MATPTPAQVRTSDAPVHAGSSLDPDPDGRLQPPPGPASASASQRALGVLSYMLGPGLVGALHAAALADDYGGVLDLVGGTTNANLKHCMGQALTAAANQGLPPPPPPFIFRQCIDCSTVEEEEKEVGVGQHLRRSRVWRCAFVPPSPLPPSPHVCCWKAISPRFGTC